MCAEILPPSREARNCSVSGDSVESTPMSGEPRASCAPLREKCLAAGPGATSSASMPALC